MRLQLSAQQPGLARLKLSQSAPPCRQIRLDLSVLLPGLKLTRGWNRGANHRGSRRNERYRPSHALVENKPGIMRHAVRELSQQRRKLPAPTDPSLAKQRVNTLFLEGVNDSAVELFLNSKYLNVERMPNALEGNTLREAIKDIDLLGIRSRRIGKGASRRACGGSRARCFSSRTVFEFGSL